MTPIDEKISLQFEKHLLPISYENVHWHIKNITNI